MTICRLFADFHTLEKKEASENDNVSNPGQKTTKHRDRNNKQAVGAKIGLKQRHTNIPSE